jgi:cytochrome c5
VTLPLPRGRWFSSLRANRYVRAAKRIVSVLGCVAPIACGSGQASTAPDGGDAASCPNDLPASCPASPPSYQNDVEAILQRRCTGCHVDGGEGAPVVLTTYGDVHKQRQSVLTQVYSCRMPRSDAPSQLSADERKALLEWLVCGAPNN